MFRRLLPWLIFALASCVFLIRGPLRMMRAEFNDLSTPYVSARLWMQGADPYDHSLFMQEWTRAGGVRFVNRGSSTTTRPAYPPPTLPALLPIAVLPWKFARIVFAILATPLYAVIVWKLRRAQPLTLAIIVGMSAVGTAIGGGNVAILAIELAVLSVLTESPTGTGLLLGLSVCIKPQLAIWLILYYVMTKKWRAAFIAIATVAASCSIALLRMPATWLASYTANLTHFFSIGGVNDFTSSNPSRFELVNLQVAAYSLTHDYSASNLVAWLITGVLLALWSVWCLRKDHGLLAMATVSAIGLLPVYQRFYNLPILLLLLVWAIKEEKIWPQRAFALLIIPWTAILAHFTNDRLMSGPSYTKNLLAQTVILPWMTWFLMGVVGFGVWKMKPARTGDSDTLAKPAVSPQALAFETRNLKLET